jgi:hypothetical protein
MAAKKHEAEFVVDKDDVGGGVRAKGERGKGEFYGSLYISGVVSSTARKFKVTVEPIEEE